MTTALDIAPEAAAVFCGFRMVDPGNNPLFQTGPGHIEKQHIHDTLLDGNFIAAHCLLVRRNAYEQTGRLIVRWMRPKDWDMWLRLSRHNTMISIPDRLVRYRVQSGSMSDDPQRMLDNRLAVLQKVQAAGPSCRRSASASTGLRLSCSGHRVAAGR